jgi:hypothetical protein
MIRTLRARFSTVTNELEASLSSHDTRILRKIDIQRKALIVHQQKAYKEGRIEPMINILEKIQKAMKNNIVTPAEKLETSLAISQQDSIDDFLTKLQDTYGNFTLDLYGDETDFKQLEIRSKGEIVPARVYDEDEMMEVRKYYYVNFNVPGLMENIHPNKFLKLKPIEEFPLLPIIPISPSVMKRFQEDLDIRRKQGYKFRVDRSRVLTGIFGFSAFGVFLVLLYLLQKKDEDSWVEINLARQRKYKREDYIS